MYPYMLYSLIKQAFILPIKELKMLKINTFIANVTTDYKGI
jgi:hypothetical protein